MELIKFVGERIREFRLAFNGGKGLSQAALADKIGKQANTISRWETGEVKPSIEELDKLSHFFGISILKFFPKDEEEPKDQALAALLRSASDLRKEDIEELKAYVEFRKARHLYLKPRSENVGRGRKKK